MVWQWYFLSRFWIRAARSPGTNFKPWPSSHLLVPPVRSLPSRCRHHLAQRLRRPPQATGHGEPPNLTLTAGCRQHPAAERPVAAAGAHWKVCTRGNKRRSCTAPCSCRASCVLQAVAHTRSLATPGCFTTTVHRGSQVQVRGALSTRHCGFMCTLSAQRACCVCLRYARLRFPCSRCVHLLFVSCAVVRALAVHSRAARLRAGWACGALVQRSPRLCGIRSSTSSTSRGCTGPCFELACMLALSRLRLPCSCCVYLLCMRLLCMLALCALALPMLALRAPAVRALAVHARAVRFRAVRVLCLCSAHLHHAELVDIADNTPLINPSSTPAT